MTDTNPRLEAVAKAHRETELPATLSWDQREARRFIAMYDVLRAFDQARCVCEMPDYCPKFGCIKEAHIDRAQLQRVRRPDGSYGFPDVNKPQPESEVMPHSDSWNSREATRESPRAHNVSAPVMGADLPWIDDISWIIWNNYRVGSIDDVRKIVRTVIAFANAQSPSEAEVEEASCAYSVGIGDKPVSHKDMRAALIAAAKARSRV